ncbi:hypothetical protein GE300_12080 [Rhodobacteraceae bacterium 2CG4]|uniref:SPW repeat-containing protein n=1 Tax=Halovulum marinum TaxID=2662447 RepID=A0A6L5Z1H2_9RHOB|nr:hypothetical protein [Halovulum marinum]MSU90348.1 hypothetical protein [Halovulum marinum]
MGPGGKTDFLSTLPGALIAWGLPIVAMVLVIGVPHPVKTWTWTGALIWMGTACLWNARRCGRRHCFWTGPFFLAMAIVVLAFGYGHVDLGSQGWKWLAAAIGLGAWVITAVTERKERYR